MSQLVLTVLLIAGEFPGTAPPDEDPTLQDATLNDVQFVDARLGWAVGERGVIWHTEDGGASWQLQPSGTVCSLRAVCFINEKTGWIAGGQGMPFGPASFGLVLTTWDGGLNWQAQSWQQLPRLHGIQFLGAKLGWAWGETSDAFRSGLFSSESGGQLWSPASGSAGTNWLSGAFSGRDRGVLGGSDGTLAILSSRAPHPVTVASLGGRGIRRAKLGNDGTVWAVGDGGLVLRSDTQGGSWLVANANMPAEHRAIFDWRGVHALGRSAWVVGRPGSVVLTTDDAGAHWQAAATNQPVPLEAVWFNDRQHGWAVGALGTILATQDAGRSWRVQRRGGERAALLAVHADAATSPLLAHAQLGADRGYLCADLSIVGVSQEQEDSPQGTSESRLADAVVVAGGSRAECEWRFPSNPVALSLSQVLEDWNRRSEGKAMRELERRLVVAIRTWRPEVIIADSPDPTESPSPAAAIVSQALGRAFLTAADPTAFPELIDQARLPAWTPKRLFTAARKPDPLDVQIDASEFAGSTGKSLDELASLAVSLLAESFRESDPRLCYHLTAGQPPSGKPDNSLMAGIMLEPGGPARRKLVPTVEITAAARQAEQHRRTVLAVVDRAAREPVAARQITAQVGDMLKRLEPDQAGGVLFRLARVQFSQGRWSETRQIFEKLIMDYPQHLAAAEAHRWLVQFYASSELRHREHSGGVVGQASLQFQPPPSKAGDPSNPGGAEAENRADPRPRGSVAQQAVPIGRGGSDVPWARGSIETAKRLLQAAPLAWSDPAVQFPLAAAHRQLGNLKDAEKFYTMFALGNDSGPWADAARSERWVRDRQGIPPKPVLVSQQLASPPRLDGSFDDAAWKSISPVPLHDLTRTDADGWETSIRVAHDRRFIYLALQCNSPAGERVTPLRPRQHDADLSAQDRVDLYFDLDRDFATYFHLAVDQRGCVAEDCWGDRTWDPTWYVASQNDEHGYRIEAAIPLAELTDSPVPDGTVWAFNAVRVVPGQRVMSWSRPAGVDPRPEGFGLLLFSDGPPGPIPRAATAN